MRDSSFINTISSDSREARDMASRLTNTPTRSELAEAGLAERTALSERLSVVASMAIIDRRIQHRGGLFLSVLNLTVLNRSWQYRAIGEHPMGLE
jgi:hypothetical protein